MGNNEEELIHKDKVVYNLKKLWKIIEGDLSPETLWKVAKEFEPGHISAFAMDTIYERQNKGPNKAKPDEKK